jgi:AcrR family transcriptional regulator
MTTRIPKWEKGIETNQRILNSTINIFAKNGFYKTNTKEIVA